MHRSRPLIWAARVGLVAIVAGTLASFATGPAQAAIVDVPFTQEGTFWRTQQRAPIADIPCNPPVPQDRCGPASPGPTQSPEVPEATVAVGHSGGTVAADGGDAYGDQYWAVFEIDLLSAGDIENIDKLVLSLSRFGEARSDFGPANVMACNVVTPFGASEGTNPWADRPAIDCSAAKPGVADPRGGPYTFDVTDFATTWVAGTGYGVAIVPGVPGSSQVVNDPSRTNDIPPFHITFVGSEKRDASGKLMANRAKASLQFTPGTGDDLLDGGGDLGFEDSGDLGFGVGGDVSDFDSGDLSSGDEFAATELGDGTPTTDAGTDTVAGRPLRTRPVASSPGFPWMALLLLPLGAVAFWGTGTALSEAGDPVLPREGGVSRILARRRAGGSLPTDSTPR